MSSKGISLREKYPEIAAEWDDQNNKGLSPDTVSYASHARVWWICRKEGHRYSTRIDNRTQHGSDCPYCNGKAVLQGYNDLATVYPDVAAEWHPTLNGTLLQTMMAPTSQRKLWWRCEEGHEWVTTVANRVSNHTDCPYCRGYTPAMLSFV